MSEIVNDLGATKEEDDMIAAHRCGSCDFGTGQRGMDRCSKCDGTGSVLVVHGERFPNDRAGYSKALEFLRTTPKDTHHDQ